MNTLFIVGLDTVAGANLANAMSPFYRITGVCSSELTGAETLGIETVETVRCQLAVAQPSRVVYCGEVTRSSWETTTFTPPSLEAIDAVAYWAKAAAECHAKFTLLSTDAVFTGPWLFHDEDSNCQCRTTIARRIRRVEKQCQQRCPDSLVIRTHLFGWSPEQDGFLEQTVDDLEAGIAGPFDFQSHATPILVTDFAEILRQVWNADLQGVYHIAGGERMNKNQFVHRLAAEFGLPAPNPVDGNCLQECSTGYGCGETSLHTIKLRRELDIAMPSFAEGLQRLREQCHNGYCDRLKTTAPLERAA